jgi:glycosyltransferase involved in cell wall biosynthesis
MTANGPVRVLHLIDSLSPGGAERVLIDLVSGLHQDGCDVSVCVSRTNTTLAGFLPSDVRLYILDRRKTWDWSAIRRLINICKDNEIHILHAHGRSSTKLCALIKLLSTRKISLIFHDHFGDIHVDKQSSFIFRWVCRQFVDFYIGVDQTLQQWAIKTVKIKPDNTITMRNAINLKRFLIPGVPSLPLPNNPTRQKAVIVANLRPQKNHPFLFSAFANSIQARDKLDIYIVGSDLDDEYSKYCHQIVKDLGISEHVFFLGCRDDIPQLISLMDFGLLSSRSESGPITILEYMACRLPFLVTNTGQITAFLNELKIPFIVETTDIPFFSKSLDRLVSLPKEERMALGEANRMIVEKYFSTEENIAALKKIYANIA